MTASQTFVVYFLDKVTQYGFFKIVPITFKDVIDLKYSV